MPTELSKIDYMYPSKLLQWPELKIAVCSYWYAYKNTIYFHH